MVMNTVYTGSTPVTVDLVLVHELSGDVVDSWKSPVTGVVWAKHLLPLSPDINQESFRVLSFGYNGNATVAIRPAPPGRNTVDENASDLLSELHSARQGQPTDRPIIFVAHGYGGLMVKAASISQAAIGVIFLATPHSGAGNFNMWEDIETPATGLTPKRYNVQVAADMRWGSSTVSRIARDFIDVASGGLQIVSISETLPSRAISGGTFILVSAINSRVNHVNETTRSLAAKHYDMTVADNRDDPRFLSLAGEIGRILKTFRDGTGPKKPDTITPEVVTPDGTVQPGPLTADQLRTLYQAAFRRWDLGTAVYYNEQFIQLLSATKGVNDPEALKERENWKTLRTYQGYK
ncbi:hypothetical protein DL770_006134 [Monosporascus sp. CRB-9-2]|nr:hypothetical protein DL770_006134 [Monosporascus sp. CRB-9-2]